MCVKHLWYSQIKDGSRNEREEFTWWITAGEFAPVLVWLRNFWIWLQTKMIKSVKDFCCLWLSIQFFFSLSSSSIAHHPSKDPIHLHTACFRSSPKSVTAVCFQTVPIFPQAFSKHRHGGDQFHSKWASIAKPSNNDTRSCIFRLLSFKHPNILFVASYSINLFSPSFFLPTRGWNKLL